MTTFTEEYLQQLIQKHSEPIINGDKVTYEVLCMPKDYDMGQYDKAHALIEDLLAPEVSEVVVKSVAKFNLWGFR